VALLGLAFKANTDDMREASSLVLAARLQADGATVAAYDPIAEDEARKRMSGVQFADSALEAVRGADAAILVTEWPEFAELDWGEVKGRMSGDLLVDGRNFVDRDVVQAAGFTYEGIGRCPAAPARRAGADPGRWRGNAAAAADLHGAQAGRPAGGPAIHCLHDRVAPQPRRR
jgi:UDPglucose 6-dehydrogenase